MWRIRRLCPLVVVDDFFGTLTFPANKARTLHSTLQYHVVDRADSSMKMFASKCLQLTEALGAFGEATLRPQRALVGRSKLLRAAGGDLLSAQVGERGGKEVERPSLPPAGAPRRGTGVLPRVRQAEAALAFARARWHGRSGPQLVMFCR